MSSLTPRQAAFVDHYALTGNASEAARRAGYSDVSAKVTAHRLLTKANVIAAVAECHARQAAELQVTRQGVIREIQEAIDMGRQQQRPDVLIQGAMALAKLCGLLEPVRAKVEVTAPDLSAMRHRFASMSDDELLAIASGAGATV